MKSGVFWAGVASLVGCVVLIVWGYQGGTPRVEDSADNELVSVTQVQGRGLPQIGGDFTLTDQDGRLRKSSEFRGKFMLVYFGYTFCPDICPTGLSAMSDALTMVGDKATDVQPIFVTVDPERDTAAQLKTYLTNFHPQFTALTGSLSDIEKIKKAYKVYAVKARPDGTSTDYLIDHSSVVYFFDPEGRFVAHFNHATPPEEMAREIKRVMNRYQR